MELKQRLWLESKRLVVAFNRTRMELKLIAHGIYSGMLQAFNRTRMELKPWWRMYRPLQHLLLTVPEWN